MGLMVGICPNCDNIVASKKKALFFSCDGCSQDIPLRQAVGAVYEMCKDPGQVNDVISLCLTLEKDTDVEVPLAIMTLLKNFHPDNEQVAFTHVRISGYDPDAVNQYLDKFANIKGTRPFATEFLDNAMQPANMMQSATFAKYITNKVPSTKQREYNGRLNYLKNEYTKGVGVGDGIISMYGFYVVCAVINVALAVFFIVGNLRFLFDLLIIIAAFGVEITVLFLHNRMFGNRLGMSRREMTFLSIFLSSIAVAIAGIFIGMFF